MSFCFVIVKEFFSIRCIIYLKFQSLHHERNIFYEFEILFVPAFVYDSIIFLLGIVDALSLILEQSTFVPALAIERKNNLKEWRNSIWKLSIILWYYLSRMWWWCTFFVVCLICFRSIFYGWNLNGDR